MNIKSWGTFDVLNQGIWRSAILRQTREKLEYRLKIHTYSPNDVIHQLEIKDVFGVSLKKKIYWRLWWTLATAAFLCTVLTAPATFSRVCMFCKTVMSWTYVPKMLWLESVQNAGKKTTSTQGALGFSRYKKKCGLSPTPSRPIHINKHQLVSMGISGS